MNPPPAARYPRSLSSSWAQMLARQGVAVRYYRPEKTRAARRVAGISRSRDSCDVPRTLQLPFSPTKFRTGRDEEERARVPRTDLKFTGAQAKFTMGGRSSAFAPDGHAAGHDGSPRGTHATFGTKLVKSAHILRHR